MQDPSYPVTRLVEEVQFSLAALGNRNGPTIDTRDWYGSTQADFSDNRKFGHPFLYLACRPPNGAVIVTLRIGVPTFPIAEPPVLSFFNTSKAIAIAAGATGFFSREPLEFRFFHVRVEDTSGAGNNDIYLVYHIRGN